MTRLFLRIIFLAPKLKRAVSNKHQRNLFIRHIDSTQFPIKFGLLFASTIFAFFGTRSVNIPVTKKIAIPFQALVAMHAITPNQKSSDQHDLQSSGTCNFTTHFEGLFDEIVVGSGPGGAFAANESTKKGNKVLLIESGEVANQKIAHHSAEQLVENFAFGGLEVILGRVLVPFAQGRALGGGSQVNSGLYHRTPNFIANEWRSIVGISEQEWRQCENLIEESLH